MLDQLSMIAWVQKHRIVTESGKPFTLRDHLFLFDMLADMSPLQVTMKCAQVGMSTAEILKTLWAAKMKGWSIAYTLPTASDAQVFVRTKVNPIIRENAVLKSYVEDGDSIGEKRVGKSNIFYRGSFEEKQAISFSADLICADEVDRSDQKVLATYASRLQHSPYKGEWWFSNPSVPGNGVSGKWAVSDQKHWFIRCGKCSFEQFLSWPASYCQERNAYQCKKCHAVLDDEARRKGRWVKKFRDREWSGYWVSLMMAPWIPASKVAADALIKPPEYFHNFVLGLPYVGGGNTVPPDAIFGNLTGETNYQDDVVIGCDSGLTKHYVLGNKDGIFSYGKTSDWGDVRRLLDRYPNSIAVIDHLPDLTEPRRLVEAYPGRVFLCHYSRDRKGMQIVRWGEDKEFGTVTVDRNRMMQLVVDELSSKKIPIYGTREEWAPFYEHFRTLYRQTETDAVGNPVFRWESSDGNDHWAHATAYWRTGMDRRLGLYGGAIIAPKDGGRKTSPTVSVDGRIQMPDTRDLFDFRGEGKEDWRL